MTISPATEAKNHFGELLEAIQRSPVEIAHEGRSVAVMMSMGELVTRDRDGFSKSPVKIVSPRELCRGLRE